MRCRPAAKGPTSTRHHAERQSHIPWRRVLETVDVHVHPAVPRPTRLVRLDGPHQELPRHYRGGPERAAMPTSRRRRPNRRVPVPEQPLSARMIAMDSAVWTISPRSTPTLIRHRNSQQERQTGQWRLDPGGMALDGERRHRTHGRQKLDERRSYDGCQQGKPRQFQDRHDAHERTQFRRSGMAPAIPSRSSRTRAAPAQTVRCRTRRCRPMASRAPTWKRPIIGERASGN